MLDTRCCTFLRLKIPQIGAVVYFNRKYAGTGNKREKTPTQKVGASIENRGKKNYAVVLRLFLLCLF